MRHRLCAHVLAMAALLVTFGGWGGCTIGGSGGDQKIVITLPTAPVAPGLDGQPLAITCTSPDTSSVLASWPGGETLTLTATDPADPTFAPPPVTQPSGVLWDPEIGGVPRTLRIVASRAGGEIAGECSVGVLS